MQGGTPVSGDVLPIAAGSGSLSVQPELLMLLHNHSIDTGAVQGGAHPRASAECCRCVVVLLWFLKSHMKLSLTQVLCRVGHTHA